jgi:AcrR family transcriptional regulator
MNDMRSERKRQREEANRLFILAAAERVFALKGYTLSTMDDIAKEAQFSKATLYHYFEGKRKILFEIILNSFDEAIQGLKRISEKKVSEKTKLKEITRFALGHFENKRNISRIFLMEKSLINTIFHQSSEDQRSFYKEENAFLEDLRNKKEGMLGLLIRVFDEGIAAGEFRKMNTHDAAHAFEAMFHGFYFTKFWYEKEYSLESATRLIHDFFLCGIQKIEK